MRSAFCDKNNRQIINVVKLTTSGDCVAISLHNLLPLHSTSNCRAPRSLTTAVLPRQIASTSSTTADQRHDEEIKRRRGEQRPQPDLFNFDGKWISSSTGNVLAEHDRIAINKSTSTRSKGGALRHSAA